MTAKSPRAASSSSWKHRRPLHDKDAYRWHLVSGDPALSPLPVNIQRRFSASAVFVVHGIGMQAQTETAVHLRAGFEDALEEILKWQDRNPDTTGNLIHDVLSRSYFRPPYIMDGYWANYSDIDKTFPEECEHFDDETLTFFRNLWRRRLGSHARVLRWSIGATRKLLCLHELPQDLGLFSKLAYRCMAVFMFPALIFLRCFYPKILTDFVGDVRLYCEPKGVSERAIAQKIDQRIASRFVKLLGMTVDFRDLSDDDCYKSVGTPLKFDRIVWVAHSLGTIISYNVLSDLFHLADEIEQSHARDSEHGAVLAEQKRNVQRFRGALRRFVTLGSPLDKIEVLFEEHRPLRPWPKKNWSQLLTQVNELGAPYDEAWWVNYYSYLDPISGILRSLELTNDHKLRPINVEMKGTHFPVAAHNDYWQSISILRYILGRTYGKTILRDEPDVSKD